MIFIVMYVYLYMYYYKHIWPSNLPGWSPSVSSLLDSIIVTLSCMALQRRTSADSSVSRTISRELCYRLHGTIVQSHCKQWCLPWYKWYSKRLYYVYVWKLGNKQIMLTGRTDDGDSYLMLMGYWFCQILFGKIFIESIIKSLWVE